MSNIERRSPLVPVSHSSDNEDERCTLLCQRLFDNEKFYNERCNLVSYYHHYNHKPIVAVLQYGPSCGLAALCMAAQFLDVEPSLKLHDVLQTAHSLGLTRRGEMFSVTNMCLLARHVMKTIQVDHLTDGLDQHRRIFQHLASGKPVLLPYDADLNHEPCCRLGHKAHWAVLTGIVFVISQEPCISTKPSVKRDIEFPLLFHDEDAHECRSDWMADAFDPRKVYVYARQGKSRHSSLWSYDSLAKSNANLKELSPVRRRSIDGYVLPVEGVEGGLSRQIILLR